MTNSNGFTGTENITFPYYSTEVTTDIYNDVVGLPIEKPERLKAKKSLSRMEKKARYGRSF
jgi:hypothetical protein